MNKCSKDSPATAEVIQCLLAGSAVVGWESTPQVQMSWDAPQAALMIINEGVDMIRDAWDAKSPMDSVYPFDMETKAVLSTSLKEQGWQQWHATVVRTPPEGEKAKRYRYPVHAWVGPQGQVILAKLKLAGKAIPV